jgi:hypothetical protein
LDAVLHGRLRRVVDDLCHLQRSPAT